MTGVPHSMCATHAGKMKADLLALIKQ